MLRLASQLRWLICEDWLHLWPSCICTTDTEWKQTKTNIILILSWADFFFLLFLCVIFLKKMKTCFDVFLYRSLLLDLCSCWPTCLGTVCVSSVSAHWSLRVVRFQPIERIWMQHVHYRHSYVWVTCITIIQPTFLHQDSDTRKA